MNDEQLLDFLLKEPVTVVKKQDIKKVKEDVLTAEQIKKRSTHERTRNERRDQLKIKRREEMKDLIDGLDDLILEDNGIVETRTEIIPKNDTRKERRKAKRNAKRKESHANDSNIDVFDQLRKEMYRKKKPEREKVSIEDSKLDRLQRLNKKLEKRVEKINQNNEKNNDGKEKTHRSHQLKVKASEKSQSEETHSDDKSNEVKPRKRERKHKSKKQIDESETLTAKITTSDLPPESHNTKENNDVNSKPKKNQKHNKKKDNVSNNDTSKSVTNKSKKRYENKIKFLLKTTDSQLFSIEY